MSSALQFFEALFGDMPYGHHIGLWAKRGAEDGISYWPSSPEEAADVVSKLRDHDVYVSVSTALEDYGPKVRIKSVLPSPRPPASIAGFWVDIDCRTPYRNKPMLPASIEEARKILPPDMQPTLIVATGGGIHAWWLFDEPQVLATDVERQAAGELVARWQDMLRRRAASFGWLLDHCHDLARVLRVPGSLNHKDPTLPVLVRLETAAGPRYSMRDLAEAIDENEKIERELGIEVSRPKGAMDEGWRQVPVQVRPNASIPEDQIEQISQIDLRFRQTWNKDRADIFGQKDQFSEYEMALANFGVKYEFGLQWIADAIVTFRRKHGGDMKKVLRLDYLQRTIYRALIDFQARHTPTQTYSGDSTEVAVSPQVGSTAPAGMPSEVAPGEATSREDAPRTASIAAPTESQKTLETQKAKPDPAIDGLDTISMWFGFKILAIVKITGKNPSYLLETEHGKVAIENTSILLSFDRMRTLVAAATNRLIPRMKPVEWDRCVQILLSVLIERDGGDDLNLERELLGHLQQYLTDVGFLRPKEINTAPLATLRKPTVIKDCVAIHLLDFQSFLFRSFSYRVSTQEIAAKLTAMGCVSDRYRPTSKVDQSRWLLPPAAFPVDQYNRDIGIVASA